jgi:hypothetical protein
MLSQPAARGARRMLPCSSALRRPAPTLRRRSLGASEAFDMVYSGGKSDDITVL